MPPDDWTDVLPRVQDPPPHRAAPPAVPQAWLRACVRVTMALWAATLGLWAWALVLAARALWGAG